MEAPRGVEPTGTNGRRRHSSPFPLLCVGVGPRLCCCWIVPGDNERWNGHEYDVDERFVSRPLAGSRTATVMMPEWFPFWSSVPFDYGFCGGHGPGVTPGPFPNPEAKAWHGDGTAPGRVWESNTPPQTFLWGFPWSRRSGKPHLFCFRGFIGSGTPARVFPDRVSERVPGKSFAYPDTNQEKNTAPAVPAYLNAWIH